jgi:hypothetical protein
MNRPTLKFYLTWIVATLFLGLWAWPAYSEEGGVTEIYKQATAPVDDETKIDAAVVVPDKTVRVLSRYKGGVFRTETRKDKMERFQCSRCHNNKDVKVAKAAEIAHGEIFLDHGGVEKPLSCFTCHKENDRDYLETEAGVKVDMDHSYELCGQCHFRQKKDWVGGAHGKRVSNWAGERVVQSCVSCHDPHSPHFDKRWPKTYSPPVKK